MPIEILMPALSPTMETGILAKWLVKEGEKVAPGDVICEIETDKATMEVEAVDEGTIGKILVADGSENVAVNTVIALLLEEGEDTSAIDTSAADTNTAKSAAPENAQPIAASSVAASSVAASAISAEAPKFVPQADPDLPEGVEMVEMSVRQALNEAMAEEMRADENVFLMGEEVAQYQGAYKISQGLLDEFGERRVVDTPITEHGFTGIAIGAAFAGLKPIVEFMTFNFAMQAIDQIINSAAKQLYMSGGQVHAPVVFRGANGAASRVGAQHSQDFTPWYANVPGLTVIAPYSAADAKGLLKASIRSQNPVVFLENELLYGQNFEVPKMDDFVLPIGKAKIVRTGADVTLIAWSIGMKYATEATEKLVSEGVDVELIDLRTIRPLDVETIVNSVKKTGRCVIVEEGWPQCSVGGDISARLMEEAFDYLDAPVTRINGKDVPMPYAANLEKLALPNVDEVVAAIKAVTYRT